MADHSETMNGRRRGRWRIAAWSVAALLLLAPLVAMGFTDEVDWTLADFVFAGALIGGAGLVLELAVRTTPNSACRAAIGCALAAAFLIIWANGAVGMIGDEDNPYNLYFGAAIAVALAGAALVRFRAPGMALAMTAAAIVQVCVAAGGYVADPRGAMLGSAMAGLWLVSAWLFRRAGRPSSR